MPFLRMASLLAAAAHSILASAPGHAQTYTIQSPITAPNFGNVVGATSGTTTFQNNGSVSVVSGNGALTSGGTVTRGLVTIRCVDGSGNPRRCNNASNKARVTVAANGSTGGRGQAISSFTAVAGTGVTLTGSTTGASLDFVMSGWTLNNQDRTFNLNVNMPVLGDNSSTATSASSGLVVNVALNPATPTGAVSATATAAVRRSAVVSKVKDIAFGTIAKPATGSGTVTIGFTVTAPNNGTSSRTAGGASPPGIITASAYSGGLFTLSAEPGTMFSLTAPTSADMTGPGGTLPVTLAPSIASGSHSMVPGGIGLGYGAAITVTSSTNAGVYSGSFQVSISYN